MHIQFLNAFPLARFQLIIISVASSSGSQLPNAVSLVPSRKWGGGDVRIILGRLQPSRVLNLLTLATDPFISGT